MWPVHNILFPFFIGILLRRTVPMWPVHLRVLHRSVSLPQVLDLSVLERLVDLGPGADGLLLLLLLLPRVVPGVVQLGAGLGGVLLPHLHQLPVLEGGVYGGDGADTDGLLVMLPAVVAVMAGGGGSAHNSNSSNSSENKQGFHDGCCW